MGRTDLVILVYRVVKESPEIQNKHHICPQLLMVLLASGLANKAEHRDLEAPLLLDEEIMRFQECTARKDLR